MIKGRILFSFRRSIFFMLLFCIPASFAQNTTSAQPIKIGSSTALEGPAQTLGQGMTLGEQLYLKKINEAGGIKGQKVTLIVYNDSYEPSLTAPNMRKLITQENVLAIIGNVGSPTAVVSVPIAQELKTLLYGCYAGAEVLRQIPPDRYVFNFRASYTEETAAMVKGLLEAGIQPDEIAFFTQNDSFGDSGYFGGIKALKEAGYHDVDKLTHGRFTRNTVNVEEGLSEILDSKKTPKAIIIVSPYLPAAKFIKMAIQDLPNTLFLNVSFVGSETLAKELGSVGNGHVIVTQVVPSYDSDLPAVKEYRESLKKYAPDAIPGYISLEGYLATKLFVLGLKHAADTNKLTREGLVDTLESMRNVDIGIGIPISFDKNNHQALHTVWPTILRNGKYISFDWMELRQFIKEWKDN
ncbi:leucine ABC transporter subunit substrate-binding protein LivK [Legionella wadsworthii]|uniref:Leucine ABC transporter subunit substrate-binding protein LivK n=1 Tax=Legionella wadsworthii TaxID=28088 RepID=A0A378LXR8_9GAMM|nr:ABC transporter substrate-binding protein [Legionella wadsworthii]STY31385.1 leucine ABC transporter subunit substrate-binding protein LivK [Legionella wadsworthii]